CRSKARVERGGDPGVPIADQKPEPADMVVEGHEQVAGLLGHPLPHHSPIGCAVTPSTWTRREATSITNSTYRRLRNTVSTVKKSTASTPLAWAPRNCRQVIADRFGAGSTPARCRMAQTVLAPSLYPSRHSSPGTLRCPRAGSPLPAAAPTRGAPPPPAAGHTGASRSNGAAPGRDASAAVSPAARTSPAKPDGVAAERAPPARPDPP